MFSAYLQFKKENKYSTLIKKRTKTLLLPYFLWITLFIGSYILLKFGVRIVFPTILTNPEKNPFISEYTALDWVKAFCGDYSDFSTICGPYLVQFWYIRDLFIMMMISPLLKKFARKFPIETLFFVFFFYTCGFRPLIVHAQALLFYTLGFLWAENNFDIFDLADKCKWKFLLPLFLLFVILNKIYDTSVLNAFSVFVSILIMLKCSEKFIKNKKIYNFLEYLSNFSFFLYAIHCGWFLEGFRKIWINIFPMKNPVLCLAEYFCVTVLICVFGTLIGICLRKIFPKVFSVFCGER